MANAWDTQIAAVTANARNRWRLDELEGPTAADSGSGTAVNGAIGTTVAMGRGNYLTQHVNRRSCMGFPDDGANSQINLPGWTMPSGDFSICGWFKTDDAAVQQYIFSHGDGSTTDYLHVLLNGGDLEVRARRSNVSISCDDITTAYAANTWYFFCYTVTGTTRSLYVNGSDVTNTNTDTLGAFTGTRIGGLADNSSAARFDGLMQDIIVFDDDLTAGEVASLYAARIPAQAVSYDDWASVSGVTTTGSTWTAANNTLTITNAAAATATSGAGTLSTTERWVADFVVNPDGGAGHKFRIILMDSSNNLALIAFDATTLSIDTDGLSLTGVTPSNWDHDAEQLVRIVGDPVSLTAHFWLLHRDTTGNDQYDYLGSVSMDSAPDRYRFSVGSTGGTDVITRPVSVWKTSDVVAAMGDSIATGSPLYSPVPREISNSIDNQTSQVAFWYAGDRYTDREVEVVNFGKGGTGASVVDAQKAWFNYLQPSMAMVWTGTNDINTGTSAASVIASLASVVAAVRGYGLPITLMTVVARPNASDADDHEQERGAINNWIKTSGVGLGGAYIDSDAITVDGSDPQILQSKYDADSVHLTTLGYKDVGESISQTIFFTVSRGHLSGVIGRPLRGRM